MPIDNPQLMIVFVTTVSIFVLAVASVRPVAAPICFLACCPLPTFMELKSVTDRVKIILRGMSVIIAPLAFTMALQHNGTAIFGNAAVLPFLPIGVFALDWLLVAQAGRPNENNGWVIFFRVLLLLCSLLMAVFAGLSSESTNLVRSLHGKEDAATRNGGEWKSLGQQIGGLGRQIEENDKALSTRGDLQERAARNRRLNELECNSPRSFVDPETGIKILGGGKCGSRAAMYLANAVAAETEIANLKDRETANDSLRSQIGVLQARQQELLTAGRSDPNSMGTLFTAIGSGAYDPALMIKVVGVALMLVIVEGLAFAMSRVRIPDGVVAGETHNQAETARALNYLHTANMAEIDARHRERRARAGNELPPLTLSTARKPTRPLQLVTSTETGND